MAHRYVRSSAGGSGAWSTAYTTLTAAFAAGAAGDQFWVAKDTAIAQASDMALNCPGTAANPCTVICVDHMGSIPPVEADIQTSPTATIATTGAFSLTMSGTARVEGIAFTNGSGANGQSFVVGDTTGHWLYFKNCTLASGTSSFSSVQIPSSSHLTLDNTQITFASANTLYRPAGMLVWKNTVSPFGTTNIPSTIVNRGVMISAEFTALDFSNAAYSTLTLFGSNATLLNGVVSFKNCKFASGMVIYTEPDSIAHSAYYLINSDSAATNYLASKVSWNGTETVETTIVRTGGASDGTTAESAKIVTNALTKWICPFEAMLLPVWNDTVGSVTVTVYGIWGGGAVPNNDDIWIEVSYLGSGSSPLATINTSNTKATFLTTAAAQTADAVSTWGGSTTKFKMSVTVTTGMKGPIYVALKAGAASGTFYVDRKPVLS